MANTKIDHNQIEWSATSGNRALYFLGQSLNGLIEVGDNSSAQFWKMGMGSVIYFGNSMKLGIVLKVGSTAAFFNDTVSPKCYIDRRGRIYFQGTGTIGGVSVTGKIHLSGKSAGDTGYMILDLTNNSAGSVDVTPTALLYEVNLQNFRWNDAGNTGDDAVTWDGVNNYMEITSSGLSNIYVGFRACTATQHYRASDAYENLAVDYLGAGDLPDTIGTMGVGNHLGVQHGSTASPTAIAAGATGRFVWAIAYKTTQVALQSAMASFSSTPTTDIDATETLHTTSKLTMNFPDFDHLSKAYDINTSRLYLMSNSQTISSLKGVPAGAYTFTFPFGRDGYYGNKAILQVAGGSAITADEYALFKLYENVNNSQEHEVAMYSNASGRYITSGNNGAPGDQDAYQILKAYEYYIATQDSAWLSTEIASINEIGTYLSTYYAANSKHNDWFAGHGTSTYLDGAGNITGGNPMHDPVMASLMVYMFYRLAELNTAAGNSSQATTWTTLADTMSDQFQGFWNHKDNWPYFNVKTDGTVYRNRHVAKVDAAVWGILPVEHCQTMATQLIDTATWWNSTDYYFYEIPTTDSLYDGGSYWYGSGWHITDFKAFELVFRYGTSVQAKTAWGMLKQLIYNRLDTLHGQLGEKYNSSGVFAFSVGALQEMVVRGLFGIDAHTTYFTISPNTYKLNVTGNYVLNDLKMGNQSYNITVRGVGSTQKVYVNGVLQSSNRISYSANTTILVECTGRYNGASRSAASNRVASTSRIAATSRVLL